MLLFPLVGIWVYIETFVLLLGFNFRALSLLPSDKAAFMTTGTKLFFLLHLLCYFKHKPSITHGFLGLGIIVVMHHHCRDIVLL